MEEIKSWILEVLSTAHLMTLATKDNKGLWTAPVIFIFDEELNLYWMSDPDVRHSKAILKNPKIAGTIVAKTTSKENFAIQFAGTASKIYGPRFDLAKKHFAKRGLEEPKEEDDVLQGDSWYMIKPDHIDLIHGKLFGFNKKKLILK